MAGILGLPAEPGGGDNRKVRSPNPDVTSHSPLAPEASPSVSPAAPAWSIRDADELYRVSGWSEGYFTIGEDGRIAVRRHADDATAVPLDEIRDGLRQRGFATPLVLRFDDILRDRLEQMAVAFGRAIEEHDYQGRYRLVFPIKVNQQRHVVEEIYRHGAQHGFGIEVGSKPELLAALPLTAGGEDRPIVCNGFKDDRYIEAVILATKLGRNIIPVVEDYAELERIVRFAKKHRVRPHIGARVKLATRGVGRWETSSGHHAKFGLFVSELLAMHQLLAAEGMADCLELLHCHVGSQIHDIRVVKNVINELGQVYVELQKMGAGLRYLDLGGGLGVDYDGSQRSTDSSMNYTLQEYANDLIARVANVCNQAGIEHPTLFTESGRAMTAHHSVLIVDVLGSSGVERICDMPIELDLWKEGEEIPQPVLDLHAAWSSVDSENYWELYHDAQQAREEAIHLFALGYLGLPARALVERMFWSTAMKVRDFARTEDAEHEDLETLEDLLRATYFTNFSLFQSLPDSWAIDQLFPVVPLTRLDEEPDQRAVLADITCDSDGKVDRFIGEPEPRATLDLHSLKPGESYCLGFFLVGAYQETLGDLHNLFGDTHVAHIQLEDDGGWTVEETVEGDTVREVLSYVQYDVDDLVRDLRRDCERAARAGQIEVKEARDLMRFFEAGLAGYTYLEGDEHDD
ncbi:MAG: arginine decarboxylase [Planctomycetes bacterium]|nr:arginine decarboxylase [Planctomycetota bacterium]